MNYKNIIHISDNLLIFKDNIYIFNKIIKHSYVINNELFIKKYLKILKDDYNEKIFFNKDILIIYDNIISTNELNNIKNIFYQIGYKKVALKSDISLLNINKNDSYLIKTYLLKFIYVDNYNQKRMLLLDNTNLNNSEIIEIIRKRVKNNLLIVNYDYFNELDRLNNYYFEPYNEKFFINLVIG